MTDESAESRSEDAATVATNAEHDGAADTVHGFPVTFSQGQRTVHVPRDQLFDLVKTLRDEGWVQCLDVTAVDYLGYEAIRDVPAEVALERFELIVTLISHTERQRIRLRVQVPAEDPVCPSLWELFPGTDALEREVFDMFGIRFTGHPDLTRILMPEDWEGYPLRKDYPVGRIPVQFKGAPTR
jgi:NADH-quinone oxidoreductase subunit C